MKKYLPIFLPLLMLGIVGYVIKTYQVTYSPTSITLKAYPTRVPYENSDMLWYLIQEWRRENHLNPYIKDQKLCQLANERVKEIQVSYNHDGFINRHLNFEGSENISALTSVQASYHGWLESPPHLKNLKYDYKYSCVAFENQYAVQVFANF